jgi:predicted ATPase
MPGPAAGGAAAARALAIAEEHGFTQANQNRSCLAWALAHLGDTAQAVALAEQSLPGWVGGGIPRLAEARRVLAQVQALNGQKAEALAGLDSLCAAPLENPAILCAHLICRAELQIDLGRSEPAEADLRAAIALAQPRQARAMELRAATLLARLLQARGDDGGARALLAPVYAGFTEGFDILDLQEAKALLDELV